MTIKTLNDMAMMTGMAKNQILSPVSIQQLEAKLQHISLFLQINWNALHFNHPNLHRKSFFSLPGLLSFLARNWYRVQTYTVRESMLKSFGLQ